MFVLENQIPYIPATVFHDSDGNVPWSNPIRFFANGTLPIDIYFDPDVVYRLEFRQGFTQADPLIYLVENYAPGSSGNTPVDEVGSVSDNQITNPQFALINFTNPTTFTGISTQTINIAPGWFLDLTGTGNVTLSQTALNSSLANATNAPYALHIQLSGTWSTAILRQRFNQNGMLWTNNSQVPLFVSCSVTASINGPSQPLTAQMVDSSSIVLGQLLDIAGLNGTLTEYLGNPAQFPATTNTNNPPTAWIDFQVMLPVNSDLLLTSFQIIASNLADEFEYQQISVEREIDHTYHVEYPIVPIGTIIDYFGFTTPAHYLPCDNRSISRVTFNQLFSVLTNQETVTLTNGSPSFTVANGALYAALHPIEGTGIPPSTLISSISGNTITMTNNATVSGAQALTFFATGNGDGSTTFNTPALIDSVIAAAGGTLLPSAGAGSLGGASTVTITANNLPAHVHNPLNPGSSLIEGVLSGGSASLAAGSTVVGTATTGTNTTSNTPISVIQQTRLAYKLIRFE
jgi:microcystin-dependent protein